MLREQLLSGKSGAFVGIVDVDGHTGGVFILKVGAIPQGWDDEVTRYESALAERAFSRRIPELVATVRDSSRYALLMKVAGGSRILWKPLLEATGLFGDAYRHLGDLLWGDSGPHLGPLQPIAAMLPAVLAHQLDPAAGRIVEHASRFTFSAVASSPTFAAFDRVLPNPLYFALNAAQFPEPQARVLLGPCHGDCHAGNVFIRSGHDGSVADATLIDFGSYRSEAPYFFDHAYFELGTLLRQLAGIGYQRWFSLVQALAAEDEGAMRRLPHEERSWAIDIHNGRASTEDHLKAGFSTRYDDVRLQRTLARVAAGLSFVNKVPREGSGSAGMTKEQYVQAFLWASIHLAEYQKDTQQLAAEQREVPALVLSAVPRDAPTIAEQEWRALGGLDQAGLNVLVLSPTFSTRMKALLSEFGSVPWSLVLDLATEPLSSEIESTFVRPIRVSWAGSRADDLKTMARGTLWQFCNGRSDISDAAPASSAREWQRKYWKTLADFLTTVATHLAPPAVRVVVLGEDFDHTIIAQILSTLDAAFGDRLAPVAVPSSLAALTIVDSFPASAESLAASIVSGRNPKADLHDGDHVLVPHRSTEGVVLRPLSLDLVRRVEKDLVVVSRSCGASLPEGRGFGAGFLRGMRIEWAELAQGLDIPRAAYLESLQADVLAKLEESTNATINLVHEPSAGGTTLSRRLAWNVMEQFPVVVVEQFSQDTAGYLRELFNATRLPLLVVMESEVVIQSTREALLIDLREDNVRAVFLWVTRTYAADGGAKVLSSSLNQVETEAFLAAYLEVVKDPIRRNELSLLAKDSQRARQRSPFFFGLTAFGSDFVGLGKLVQDTIDNVTDKGRLLLADIALVSRYSGTGFPKPELEEVASKLGVELIDSVRPPFAVYDDGHVRNPHALIAEHTLVLLSRQPDEWMADLARFSDGLLDHIAALENREADRLLQMVETVFLTRDSEAAIASDAEMRAGGLAYQRRFSPLILDIGSSEKARSVLKRLVALWPDQPHHAIHCARHLLYEPPAEVQQATEMAEAAEADAAGAEDPIVVHVVGMCYRLAMEQVLSAAIQQQRRLGEVEVEARAAFDTALERFARAIDLAPGRSEYGHVATIQTITTLITLSRKLTRDQDLPSFLAQPGRRWCVDAVSRAEEHIDRLRSMPQKRLSNRAERTIAEWDLVYGNVELVVTRLRMLASRRADPEIRRALCNVIFVKHQRRMSSVPPADLMTITQMLEQNIGAQGVRDSDVRLWLRAYRHQRTFDPAVAIRRLIDWQQLAPRSAEPALYLYIYYFLQWLGSKRMNAGYATEVDKWRKVCANNRAPGFRSWGYEWLKVRDGHYEIANFHDLSFDPVATLNGATPQHLKRLETELARVEGVVIDYVGPQQARLDLGNDVHLRFTPRDHIVRDDVGKRASVFVAFGYDGPVGWSARRV